MNRWTRLFTFLALLTIAAAVWQFWPYAAPVPVQQAAGSAREIPVVLASVQSTTVPLSYPATGTVEAISSIPLRARVDGEVTAVHVPDGASVKAGDPILDIDPRAADAEIAGQRALVERDKAALAKAERDLMRAEALTQSNVITKVSRLDTATMRALAKAALGANQAKLDQLETNPATASSQRSSALTPSMSPWACHKTSSPTPPKPPPPKPRALKSQCRAVTKC